MWKGMRNNDVELDWRMRWRCWCSGIVGWSSGIVSWCGGIIGRSSRCCLLTCGLDVINIGVCVLTIRASR